MNTLNLDITKTVCFTGHRPKDIIKTNPYDETSRNQYQKLVDYTVTRINALIDQGYINFISGGAQGFDQLAFWAVNKAKKDHPDIQNIVYIPFIGQESRWAKTGLFSQHEYQLMLNRADDTYVCSDNIDTTDYKATIKALFHRNECMVNDSSYVLGLYYKSEKELLYGKGGTASCLRYARNNNKTTELITYKV